MAILETLRAAARALRAGSPLQTARDLRAHLRFPRQSNAVRGVFDTFAAAAASAPADRKVGYDHPGHAEMYDHRLGELVIADYPALFWVARLLPDLSSLFDYGGHVGLLYYGFAKRLAFPPGFRWLVCDMPGTAQRGRVLADRAGAVPLHFTSEWPAGDGSGLLVASGVLQYVEAHLAERLRLWERLPAHVLINNTPMYDGPAYVTLQNTHLSYNPYRVFNRAELIRSIEALGYRLRDAWRHDRWLRVPLHPERAVEAYQGLFFERAGT